MREMLRCAIVIGGLAASAVLPVHAEEATKAHHLVLQIDTNDPATMNQTLNNATNVIDYYRDKHEEVRSTSSPTARGSTC